MTNLYCDKCGWAGDRDGALEAQHPFHESKTITGCPCCGEINNTLMVACSVEDCGKPAAIGATMSSIKPVTGPYSLDLNHGLSREFAWACEEHAETLKEKP